MNKKDKQTKDYKIGFKKPPKQTRFVRGQSGNPHGRPKGKRNWATVLHSILEQKVRVTENGRTKIVTKWEAATTQLANKAASGDVNSISKLIQIVPNMEHQLTKAGAPVLSDEQDRKVVVELIKRIKGSGTEVIGPEPSNKKKDENGD
jgi:hypothetical protein